MKKKILIGSILAVALLTLVSFSSAVGYSSIDKNPVSDLDCDGSFDWTDVEPGATVTGIFIVENIGEPESLLNWEIQSYPDWGTWTFVPDSGTSLLAGEPITVDVEVVFPDPLEEEQWDEIIIVNIDNPDDFCVIDVYYRGKPVNADAELSGIIEKLESFDCGCEYETTELGFPTLCTLLYPLSILSGVLFLLFHIRQFYDLIWSLGTELNCFWASPE
jgi:hypothetical protein